MRSEDSQTPHVSLALASDAEHMNDYDILLCKQLEVFEAGLEYSGRYLV